MRSHEYTQGKRAGIKWAISWLHAWANEMNDPHAKAILNTAAFNMGIENRTDKQREPSAALTQDQRAMPKAIENEIPYGHQEGGKLKLTRLVTMEECPWLERDYANGETVVRYTGATYGCIGSGIACSESGHSPFFELPRDALVSA